MSASEPIPPMSRFDLPGLNLPLNFRPHPGESRYDPVSKKLAPFAFKGEGQNLFRTALNSIDENGDGGYVA
jgi:hypothetical protein